MTNPTRFATIEVGWGAQQAHVYHSETSMADIQFHKTEEEARQRVSDLIRNDDAKLVALIEIKALYEANIIPKEVA